MAHGNSSFHGMQALSQLTSFLDPYTIMKPSAHHQVTSRILRKARSKGKGFAKSIYKSSIFGCKKNLTSLPANPISSGSFDHCFSLASSKFFMHEVFDRPHSGDSAVWIQEGICQTCNYDPLTPAVEKSFPQRKTY